MEPMSIDALFEQQSGLSNLSVTVEKTDDPDKVKITPFVPNVGCLCQFALIVLKKNIKSVTATGDQHVCCGNTLLVVTIEFSEDAAYYSSIFSQLAANAASPHAHSDHSHQPLPAQGNEYSPSLVCNGAQGYQPCRGRCGERCYRPAYGETCRDGGVCNASQGYQHCGCGCYRPSYGETCYNGTVIRPSAQSYPYPY